MKKVIFCSFFLASALSVFAQRLPIVGVLPFEISGTGVNAGDAEEATRLVIAELRSWELMNVQTGADAQSSEYLVQGRISRQSNQIVLTATTTLVSTGRILNNSREEAAQLNGISMESFCAKITENVPIPNFLLGKWQSVITMIDGPVTCIMEFNSDRTVNVQQYDTWEHNRTDSLKYQAIGKGTYTYAGYRRRTVTISGRAVQSDATVGVNLSLEDALPNFESIGLTGLRVLFNEGRTSFELVAGGLPCGNNFSGPSVYSSENVYYTRFNKVQ